MKEKRNLKRTTIACLAVPESPQRRDRRMDRLRHVACSLSPAEPRLIAATALGDELLEQTPVIIGVARVTPRVEITVCHTSTNSPPCCIVVALLAFGIDVTD